MSVELSERRVYTLTLANGRKIELEESEILDLRNKIEKHPHFKRIPLVDEKVGSAMPTSSPDVQKFTAILESTRKVELPSGFREIGRRPSNSSAYPSTYVYGKRDVDGMYGFKKINGHDSDFSKIGKISDENSVLGEFVRAIPKGKLFKKRDFYKLKEWRHSTNGTNTKAQIDILEIEGYLVKRQSPDQMYIAYSRTDKMDGLEVENNREPLNNSSIPLVH